MKKWAAKAAFLTLIAVFGLALVTRQVLAATKVSPSSMNGWAFQVTGSSGAIGTFVSGPSTTPLGVGSARFYSASDGSQTVALHNSTYANTKLSNVTRLEYSTFATTQSGAAILAPFMYIDVTTGLGSDRLVFNPNAQTSAASTNVWQNWNAKDGNWRSNNFSGFTGGTLAQYLTFIATFDSSDVLVVNRGDGTGGIRAQMGPAGTSDVYDANVDNFIINTGTGDTTYDFDPDPATNSVSQQFYNSTTVGTNPVGSPTTISSNAIKNNWGTSQPAPGVGPSNWSAKWEGTFDMTTNRYRFATNALSPTDEVKMYVDGALVLDKLPGLYNLASAQLETAGIHTVRIDYIHTTGNARMAADFWKTSQCADMNGDNVVNSIDLGIVAAYFPSHPTGIIPWDVNGDKAITAADLGVLATTNVFNKPCPVATPINQVFN